MLDSVCTGFPNFYPGFIHQKLIGQSGILKFIGIMTWMTERKNAKTAMESIYGKTMSKSFCEFYQVLISIIAPEMEKKWPAFSKVMSEKTFNESYVKLIYEYFLLRVFFHI